MFNYFYVTGGIETNFEIVMKIGFRVYSQFRSFYAYIIMYFHWSIGITYRYMIVYIHCHNPIKFQEIDGWVQVNDVLYDFLSKSCL